MCINLILPMHLFTSIFTCNSFTRMDQGTRMARSTSSRSVDRCAISKSALKNTEECKKFSQTPRPAPFLRACGCAHRFFPTSMTPSLFLNHQILFEKKNRRSFERDVRLFVFRKCDIFVHISPLYS